MSFAALMLMALACGLMMISGLLAVQWKKSQQPKIALLPAYRMMTVGAALACVACFLNAVVSPREAALYQNIVWVMGAFAVIGALAWQTLAAQKAAEQAKAREVEGK